MITTTRRQEWPPPPPPPTDPRDPWTRPPFWHDRIGHERRVALVLSGIRPVTVREVP